MKLLILCQLGAHFHLLIHTATRNKYNYCIMVMKEWRQHNSTIHNIKTQACILSNKWYGRSICKLNQQYYTQYQSIDIGNQSMVKAFTRECSWIADLTKDHWWIVPYVTGSNVPDSNNVHQSIITVEFDHYETVQSSYRSRTNSVNKYWWMWPAHQLMVQMFTYIAI